MTQETGGMTIMKLQEKPLTRHIRQTELKITRNDDSGVWTHPSIANNRELSEREDIPLQNYQLW